MYLFVQIQSAQFNFRKKIACLNNKRGELTEVT